MCSDSVRRDRATVRSPRSGQRRRNKALLVPLRAADPSITVNLIHLIPHAPARTLTHAHTHSQSRTDAHKLTHRQTQAHAQRRDTHARLHMQPSTPLHTCTREHFGRPTRRPLQERRPTSSWPIELVADVIVVTMQVLCSPSRGALARRGASRPACAARLLSAGACVWYAACCRPLAHIAHRGVLGPWVCDLRPSSACPNQEVLLLLVHQRRVATWIVIASCVST